MPKKPWRFTSKRSMNSSSRWHKPLCDFLAVGSSVSNRSASLASAGGPNGCLSEMLGPGEVLFVIEAEIEARIKYGPC
jgi:hypothetical protein